MEIIGKQHDDGYDFPDPLWMVLAQPDKPLGFSRSLLRTALSDKQFSKLEEYLESKDVDRNGDDGEAWCFSWEWRRFILARINEREDQIPEEIRMSLLQILDDFAKENPFKEEEEVGATP